MFGNPAWRKRPVATTARFLSWLVRKNLSAGRYAILPYDGGRSRIRVDLQSRFGFIAYTYGEADPDTALVGALLAPGDIVLDPFFGSGTVGLIAMETMRRCIGIELNEDYVKMARRRISAVQMNLLTPAGT